MRFVAAADVRSWEEIDWGLDTSVKLGLDIGSPHSAARSVQLLLEYFGGNLPYGQFFNLDAHYFGVGVTFAFGRRGFPADTPDGGTNTTHEAGPREEGSY